MKRPVALILIFFYGLIMVAHGQGQAVDIDSLIGRIGQLYTTSLRAMDSAHLEKANHALVQLEELIHSKEQDFTETKHWNLFNQYKYAFYTQKGYFHFHVGNLVKAEHTLDWIDQQEQDYLPAYFYLQNLAHIHWERGAYERAIHMFEKCLNDERLPTQKEVLILKHMGSITWEAHEDYDKARDYYQRAAALLTMKSTNANGSSLRMRNTSIALYSAIAELEMVNGYDEAGQAALSQLDVVNHDYHEMAHMLQFTKGKVYAASQKESLQHKAIEHYQKALDLRKTHFGGDHHFRVAEVYLALGQAYDAPDSAIYHLEQAKTSLIGRPLSEVTRHTLKDIQNLPMLLSIFHEEAKVRRRQGQNKEAMAVVEKAMIVLDEVMEGLSSEHDKIKCLSDRYGVFELALDLFYEKEDHMRAFEIFEKSKAVALRQAVYQSKAMVFGEVSTEVTDRLHILRKEIADGNLQAQNSQALYPDEQKLALIDKKEIYRELMDSLEMNNEAFFNLKYRLQTAEVDQIAEVLLDDETSLVSYFIGDSSIYAMLLDAEGAARIFRLSMRPSDVKYLCAELRTQLEQGEGVEYQVAARSLYQVLIEPLEHELKQRLIIIPDGALANIPFEVLIASDDFVGSRDHQKLSFLVKDKEVLYAYSATLLYELERAQTRVSDFVGFAPSYDRIEDFSDIPNADQLLSQIGAHFDQARLWRGGDATSEVFEREVEDAGVVHVAAHGVLHPARNSSSFIAFSLDSHDHYQLRLGDLYACPMNASLVSLSSCQTALGDYQRGEGIVSMARAFTYAGAKSILPTLWSVNAESTSELTVTFYDYLHEGLSKSKALQLAKFDLLSSATYDHPRYWAGSVLIGANQPIFSVPLLDRPLMLAALGLSALFGLFFLKRKFF